MNSKYLIIIRYEQKADKKVEEILNDLSKYKIKSRSINKGVVELTFEIELSDKTQKIVDEFSKIDGVQNSSLISYQNDFGA